MDHSFSPYHEQHHKKPRIRLPKINIPKGVKKWVAIILGIFVAIFFIFYLLLGQLRFFVNHYFGFGFFSKHYLVLLQNNYELRPGGGFITGYGNLDFFMGIPGKISFKNSYDIDTASYVVPPYPQEDMLKNEWYQGYTFRDANWNPDSRMSADELVKFYTQKYPDKDVDGIFVVNFSLIEDLIDRLGGIEVNGKKLTKDNLFSELEFEVNNVDRHNVDALSGRKNILGDIAAQMIGKAKRHPFTTRDVLVNGLNDKDFYVWMKNNSLENKLISKGWANVLAPADKSDFLAVNLANLGSKKADRYIKPEINYYANIAKEVPEITTEVTIRYPGFTNSYSDNYKGYLRIYIPKNADVISAPVDSDTKTDGEFKAIGAKIILPAGSKTTLVYTYTLPRSTFAADEYKLRLLKQSGSDALYNLTVEAADGKTLKGDDFQARENRAMFEGTLTHDLDLSLKILPDTLPPYAIEQEFTDLTHIQIIWNEPMDSTSAMDANNYTISDLNKANPTTDVVNIKSIKLTQPNVIEFELEGVTKQDLEFYRVDFKGIKDMTGNFITPNPKSITAVQRFKANNETFNIKLGEIPVAPAENSIKLGQ